MCSFEGCRGTKRSLGLCGAHYMQKRMVIELKPLRNRYSTDEERKAGAVRRATEYHQRNLFRIREIKMERGCLDCGYNSHPEALDFDHIGTDKIANVTALCYSSKWDKIETEIAKCEVVCANCHRIRTASRR